MSESVRRRPLRRYERGYATALIALLLLPMLAFAGLAVDLGAWYARAAQIQRAARAYHLAGVPLLIRGESLAFAEARRVATLNGFTDNDDGGDIHVAVGRIPGEQQLQVTITDDSAPQFITRMFRETGVGITRSATAEQVLPVPLGSPRNYLGTNLLQGSSSHREGFWTAMSGYCASREQGDRIGPVSDANFSTPNNPPPGSGNSFAGCQVGSPSHVVANPEYSSEGYFYAVEVPPTYAGRLRIQIFDAPYCGTSGSNDGPDSGNQPFDLTVTVRDNDSLTPTSATVLGSWTLDGDAGTGGSCGGGPSVPADGGNGATCSSSTVWHNCWHTIFDQTDPAPGIYFVQLHNEVDSGSSQHGSNVFSLRAMTGTSWTPCSSAPSAIPPAYSANCPNVYALTHLGVFFTRETGAGGQAEFYLAEIGPEHNNKTMEITLWDPGEGADYIEVLDPEGNPATFDYEVLCQDGSDAPCSGETAPSGGYGSFTSRNRVSGLADSSRNQPGAHRLSSYRYSDRMVRVEVRLPADMATEYGGATWWRIRYTASTSTSSITDRTTWSVIVRGDPVRLVPNP